MKACLIVVALLLSLNAFAIQNGVPSGRGSVLRITNAAGREGSATLICPNVAITTTANVAGGNAADIAVGGIAASRIIAHPDAGLALVVLSRDSSASVETLAQSLDRPTAVVAVGYGASETSPCFGQRCEASFGVLRLEESNWVGKFRLIGFMGTNGQPRVYFGDGGGPWFAGGLVGVTDDVATTFSPTYPEASAISLPHFQNWILENMYDVCSSSAMLTYRRRPVQIELATSGGGRVVLGGNMECRSASCRFQLPAPTRGLRLEAIAAPGFRFLRWDSSDLPASVLSQSSIPIDVLGNRHIVAIFTPDRPSLEVKILSPVAGADLDRGARIMVSGSGINCALQLNASDPATLISDGCTSQIAEGSTVQLLGESSVPDLIGGGRSAWSCVSRLSGEIRTQSEAGEDLIKFTMPTGGATCTYRPIVYNTATVDAYVAEGGNESLARDQSAGVISTTPARLTYDGRNRWYSADYLPGRRVQMQFTDGNMTFVGWAHGSDLSCPCAGDTSRRCDFDMPNRWARCVALVRRAPVLPSPLPAPSVSLVPTVSPATTLVPYSWLSR